MIKPMHDNILVKIQKKEREQKRASGLIVVQSESAADKPNMGIVADIGEGRYLMDGTLIPSSVKVGDKIIFNKFAGTEIQEEEEYFLLIKENDILGVIK